MKDSLRLRMGAWMITAALMCITHRAAEAAIVDPTRSSTAVLSGTTTALRPELSGLILADSTQPFEIHNDAGALLASGTLRQQVVRETESRTLDFYYQLTHTAGSHALASLWAYGFQPGKLDMDFLSDAPVSAPQPHTGAALSDGSIAAFDFAESLVGPGQSSARMFVHTRSTQFLTDASSVAIVFASHQPGDNDLENFISPQLSVARPVPVPIPLPAALYSALTVILPMGAFAVARRRRTATARDERGTVSPTVKQVEFKI